MREAEREETDEETDEEEESIRRRKQRCTLHGYDKIRGEERRGEESRRRSRKWEGAIISSSIVISLQIRFLALFSLHHFSLSLQQQGRRWKEALRSCRRKSEYPIGHHFLSLFRVYLLCKTV